MDGRKLLKYAGVAFAAILIVPTVVFLFPQLVGADDAEVVLTGSMEPKISPGDLVILREFNHFSDSVDTGDVVAYQLIPSKTDPPILHRIVGSEVGEDGKLYYILKGDANNDIDPQPVPARRILSTYEFHIPYYGYLIVWSQTQWGILVFIVAPSLAVVVREIVRLAKMDAQKRSGDKATAADTKRRPQRTRPTVAPASRAGVLRADAAAVAPGPPRPSAARAAAPARAKPKRRAAARTPQERTPDAVVRLKSPGPARSAAA